VTHFLFNFQYPCLSFDCRHARVYTMQNLIILEVPLNTRVEELSFKNYQLMQIDKVFVIIDRLRQLGGT
jgi:hypothetical protein